MALPELVGMAESADILGFSRTNFNQHRKRYEAVVDSEFPAPALQLRCGPIWVKKDMERWSAKYHKHKEAEAKALAIKVANREKAKASKEAAAVKAAAAPVKKAAPKKAPAPTATALAHGPLGSKEADPTLVKKALTKKSLKK